MLSKLLIVSLIAAGATVAAAADLPQAEKILDRYVAVTGGEAAYRKHHTSFNSGTVEIVGTGITGKVRSYHAEPNLSYTENDLPMAGKFRQGTDGAVAWSFSPIQGAKIEEGDEAALHRLLSTFNSEIHWRELYRQVETVGTENVDGQPAYVVVLTPKQGRPRTVFYDVRTGLLVKAIVKRPSDTGELQSELTLGDYRRESGILVPHKMTQVSGGNQFIVRIDTYRYNEVPPEGIFSPPAEIKALFGKN